MRRHARSGQGRCERVKAKYNAEADKVLRTAQEAVQKEAAAVLESGRSGAAMWRRNTLLEAKSKMVDEAYEKAIGFLSRMEEGAYFNLLFGMLKRPSTNPNRRIRPC